MINFSRMEFNYILGGVLFRGLIRVESLVLDLPGLISTMIYLTCHIIHSSTCYLRPPLYQPKVVTHGSWSLIAGKCIKNTRLLSVEMRSLTAVVLNDRYYYMCTCFQCFPVLTRFYFAMHYCQIAWTCKSHTDNCKECVYSLHNILGTKKFKTKKFKIRANWNGNVYFFIRFFHFSHN